MNKFKYDEAENKLLLDIPEPDINDYRTVNPSLFKGQQSAYERDLAAWNSRLSYSLSKELRDKLKDGEVYELGKDFLVYEGPPEEWAPTYNNPDDPPYIVIAIPLPEQTKQKTDREKAIEWWESESGADMGKFPFWMEKYNMPHLISKPIQDSEIEIIWKGETEQTGYNSTQAGKTIKQNKYMPDYPAGHTEVYPEENEDAEQTNKVKEPERWTTSKPTFDHEFAFSTAHWWKDQWEYKIWQIVKVDGEGGWYYGLCEGDGEEWGDHEDLQADLYYILPEPKQSTK